MLVVDWLLLPDPKNPITSLLSEKKNRADNHDGESDRPEPFRYADTAAVVERAERIFQALR